MVRPIQRRCLPVLVAISRMGLALGVQAAVFTTPVTVNEGDATYDGQDIVVDGTTATINGPHGFNSLLLTSNAVLTHSPCTTTNTHKLDLTGTNHFSGEAKSHPTGAT